VLDGKIKQCIFRNLNRNGAVEALSNLDHLARSAARLSQRSMILSLIEGGSAHDLTCHRIGAPLLFERLWQEGGCSAVVEGLLRGRRFEFPVERTVFLTVLHRLMVSGSDWACEHASSLLACGEFLAQPIHGAIEMAELVRRCHRCDNPREN
jgi:hypothetical protein